MGRNFGGDEMVEDEQYFRHKDLLETPVRRAAYSDRTAWLMAEMSRLAYSKFEEDKTELETALAEADFLLVQLFNREGTQAFLAKRESDKMAILAFRGTEKEDPRDIIADLYATFYEDAYGVKTHKGFLNAFNAVKEDISKELEKVKDIYIEMLNGTMPTYDQKHIRSIVEKLFNFDFYKEAKKICNLYGEAGINFLRDLWEANKKKD